MTPTNSNGSLLSAAAQRLIDEHRQQQVQSEIERPAITQDSEAVGDAVLEELLGQGSIAAPVPAAAPAFISKSARAIGRVYPPYTAEAMVELMIEHPQWSHAQFAAYFGYKASWFAGVLVSANFQAALEPRRAEVANPMLSGTMDDIFRAVTLQAVTVLATRLDSEKASDDLVIKAIGAGIKALGMGTVGQAPAEPPAPATLNDLASKLSQPKTIAATPARDWTIENALGELPK